MKIKRKKLFYKYKNEFLDKKVSRKKLRGQKRNRITLRHLIVNPHYIRDKQKNLNFYRKYENRLQQDWESE